MRTEDAKKILGMIESIMDKAADAIEYRAMVAEAARAGDLDPSSERFKRANERADDFISGAD